MNSERLKQIESHLQLLREQQAALEQEEILSSGLPQIQIQQKLKIDIKPKIQKYEQEYWEVLALQSNALDLSEQEAVSIVGEIVDKVHDLELQVISYPDSVMAMLKEISDKLSQNDGSAAAKLKGVISSIPPFVGISYEAEIDTENFLRNNFPTFIDWIERATKKKLS
jgi:hypothetical protein